MDRKKQIVTQVIGQGILPRFFHPDADISIKILKALYGAGVRVVEYTNQDNTAIDNFLKLQKVADKELPDLQLGAGTIRNKIEATEFINEGAHFINCPSVIEGVGVMAEKNDVLWIPGCLTVTEVSLADDLGAQLVKLFPVYTLGPSYLSSIKEIFPALFFMPSGGIETTEESFYNWFKGGASALGLEYSLICKSLVEANDYDGIESTTRQALQIAENIKTSKI